MNVQRSLISVDTVFNFRVACSDIEALSDSMSDRAQPISWDQATGDDAVPPRVRVALTSADRQSHTSCIEDRARMDPIISGALYAPFIVPSRPSRRQSSFDGGFFTAYSLTSGAVQIVVSKDGDEYELSEIRIPKSVVESGGGDVVMFVRMMTNSGRKYMKRTTMALHGRQFTKLNRMLSQVGMSRDIESSVRGVNFTKIRWTVSKRRRQVSTVSCTAGKVVRNKQYLQQIEDLAEKLTTVNFLATRAVADLLFFSTDPRVSQQSRASMTIPWSTAGAVKLVRQIFMFVSTRNVSKLPDVYRAWGRGFLADVLGNYSGKACDLPKYVIPSFRFTYHSLNSFSLTLIHDTLL